MPSSQIWFTHTNVLRGCVTPVQLANLIEDSGGDTDMVDGYDELPANLQEKVDFALENGHVQDEDWKGVSPAIVSKITILTFQGC